MDSLDALIRPAFVLIFHDTADQLVILLQELKDQTKGQCSATSGQQGPLPPLPGPPTPPLSKAGLSSPSTSADFILSSQQVTYGHHQSQLLPPGSFQDPQPFRISSKISLPVLALTRWMVS